PWSTSFRPSRYEEVVLTRLRFGHTRVTHSHLFKGLPPPVCQSDYEFVTIEHILMKCPKLRFRPPSNFLLSSVPEILENDPDSVADVLMFQKKNNFMRMI
ncbi:hypothetical protein WDU94_010115, partial [Cyamophila willieti]